MNHFNPTWERKVFLFNVVLPSMVSIFLLLLLVLLLLLLLYCCCCCCCCCIVVVFVVVIVVVVVVVVVLLLFLLLLLLLLLLLYCCCWCFDSFWLFINTTFTWFYFSVYVTSKYYLSHGLTNWCIKHVFLSTSFSQVRMSFSQVTLVVLSSLNERKTYRDTSHLIGWCLKIYFLIAIILP